MSGRARAGVPPSAPASPHGGSAEPPPTASPSPSRAPTSVVFRSSASNPASTAPVQEGGGRRRALNGTDDLETSLARGPGRTGADGPDWSLAAAGDADAFERLYREHVPRVHGLARRMVGEDVADDLTQEVFVRVWQKLWTFRGDSSFGTWLHRLAVNHILSRRATLRRAEARTVSGDEHLKDLGARPPRPGLRLDFETAIARLPEGAKQVFVLYDVEGYTHEEVAGLMGISVGTSKSQLHRARMLLRRVLG